jgi:hypothetical protein
VTLNLPFLPFVTLLLRKSVLAKVVSIMLVVAPKVALPSQQLYVVSRVAEHKVYGVCNHGIHALDAETGRFEVVSESPLARDGVACLCHTTLAIYWLT